MKALYASGVAMAGLCAGLAVAAWVTERPANHPFAALGWLNVVLLYMSLLMRGERQ